MQCDTSGHVVTAVTRDEEIIFTRAPVQRSKSAVWLGGHGSWLVAITTGCSYKLSTINLVWGPLKCTKSNFNPVHVFLHFKSFCLVVLQLISASKLSDLKNGQKIAFLLIKLSFLANGCILGQNSRKLTPLKIQFYYQDIITLTINTFLLLGNGISQIFVSFSLFSSF